MPPLEGGGLVVAGLVALAAVMTAVFTIAKGAKTLWQTFGWRGTFWAWLVRFVRTVDIIASLPARLAQNEQLLADHIAQAAPQVELLTTMARDLGLLVPIAQDVHHEVKHNGGSSIKDAIARVETGVKGLYTPAGTGPVTVIVPPAPHRSKESA